MWLFILLAIVAIILLVVFGLITYARWNFGKLENQGFVVVKPSHYLLGGAMLSFEKNGGLLDIEHMKKYGPVFGLYEGREPQIFICDAELIRLVTTKDSDHFDSKRFIDFGNPLFNELLDFQPLEKWKIVRSMASPIFNNMGRLKATNPAMREAIYDYIGDMKQEIKKNGGKLEKYGLDEGIYGMLTNFLARSQYGINLGKSESSQRFVKVIKEMMTAPAAEAPWIATYSYAFPFIRHFLPSTLVNSEPVGEFIQLIKQMMDLRRKQNEESGTTAQGQARDVLDYTIEYYDELKTNPDYKQNNITEMTVYSLGLGLFLGSEDQVSLILGVFMNYISKNAEIETKLQREVDRIWEQSKGVLDHETLQEMSYLNACILEATRLYPFFFRSERVCTKDWEEPSRGIQIKKGDVVQIALWAANRNPEYFEDPEEFKPERFMEGQKEKMHAYAFTSFGFGPRNCIGKRFAIEMMMLLAAHLVRELKFVKRSDTQVKFLPAGPFFAAHEPIVFDVETRQH